MTILVREEYVNTTKGYRFGDSGEPSEAFTDDVGRLFRSLQNEYGRCGSKMYIDRKSGGQPMHVGWVFEKRMRYEDARSNRPDDYYTREVWVTLYEPCEIEDPRATILSHANGSETRCPWRLMDIDAYRRASAA